MKRALCILVIVGFACAAAFAQQKTVDLSGAEYKLISLHSKITRFATEDENLRNNRRFADMLDSVLRIPESFDYSFADLNIGKVAAPDGTFKIYTWFMVHTNGTYDTFGFLQRRNKEKNTVDVWPLVDKSREIKNPTMANCTPQMWYGATYYDILMQKFEGTTSYVLLGWHPNSTFTQKKVIETFRFDKKNNPVFGFQLLELKGKGFQKRLIYEYSARQTMMLRYEKRKKMIVLDHISPSEFRYENIYEYYGPDFSIDGYRYKQGKWHYVPDIDLHSPRQKLKDYLPERLKSKRKAIEDGF